jgi:hypothetical protein
MHRMDLGIRFDCDFHEITCVKADLGTGWQNGGYQQHDGRQDHYEIYSQFLSELHQGLGASYRLLSFTISRAISFSVLDLSSDCSDGG